jgi:uncharacterized protein (DUF1778 family)
MILADQREFILPKDRWAKFVAALDRPETNNKRLARLISEPSILER